MNEVDLQLHFFKVIKASLPPHLSLSDHLCELLNISPDSAYRRIRGEKPLTLTELKILCEFFGISLDKVLQLTTDTVVFKAPEINNSDTELEGYLKLVLKNLQHFNSFNNKKILYLCKDAPIFYFYLFPELAAFKSFFWTKTLHNHPQFENKSFSLDEYSFPEYYKIGQQIFEEYTKIPSVELWNIETLNSTINQIKYYLDAGLFKKEEDADKVVHSFHKMIDHLENQIEKAVKFMPGMGSAAYRAPLQFYINEIIIGNNTILAELNGNKSVFLTYRALNFMMTTDTRFCEHWFSDFHTLVKRSTLISGIGERERIRFFNALRDKITNIKMSYQFLKMVN